MAFCYRGSPVLRLKHPTLDSFGDDQNGMALIPNPVSLTGPDLHVVFSDGLGWEHVSVSSATRVPTWAEMCAIKALFWAPEDAVVQFHPPRSQYVNYHERCLHLWRKVGSEFELPPTDLVGPRR